MTSALTARSRDDSPRSDRRRVGAVLLFPLVPWSVQAFSPDAPTLVFAWGLVNVDGFAAVHLVEFLRLSAGLPDYILAWPASVVLYLFALASALAGRLFGREDVRVTAGLLVLVGVAQLSLARGFSIQPGRVAYPLGTVVAWAVATWYWPLIRERTERTG